MSLLLRAKLDRLVWKAKGWQLWNILTSAWTLYLPGPASLGSVARQLWVRRPAALVPSLNRPFPSTLKAHTLCVWYCLRCNIYAFISFQGRAEIVFRDRLWRLFAVLWMIAGKVISYSTNWRQFIEGDTSGRDIASADSAY